MSAMSSEHEAQQVVVVGVDGSAESVAALRWASRYAAAMGAAIQAVLAWHYPAAVGQAPTGVAPGAVRGQIEERMRADLAQAVAQVYPDPSATEVEMRVSYGHAAQVLIDESKDADLLVVGSRGHGAFTGMLLGSVSIHCVTNATCPVTVIRER
jgi:nucleotide-binding universal stress UspA family protein